MEMSNKAAYQELIEADMPATPQDRAGLQPQITETHSLVLEMRACLSEMALEMRKHRSGLSYWVLGSYFGTMVLAAALLALAFKGLMYLFYLDGKLG